MKKCKCFDCNKTEHTTYDCLKKGKITAISKSVSENSNSQEKKQLFPILKKKAYLFLYYFCQKTYFIKVFL